MATAKERHITAELMNDPEYRAAWEVVRQTFKNADLEDPQAGYGDTLSAIEAVYRLLDRRPDLAALVELAESEDH